MSTIPTLSIREAALELQASEATIRRYLAKKVIPSAQAGKGTLIRIPRDAWNRFLEGRRK